MGGGPAPGYDSGMQAPAHHDDGKIAIEVFYDGGCPLCRREIALYSGLKPLGPIVWKDVSAELDLLPAGRTQADLLARFHVTAPDGRLVSGAEAFLALWEQLPGWRWLARLGRLPGMPVILEWSYRGFLKIRPSLQRLAARLG